MRALLLLLVAFCCVAFTEAGKGFPKPPKCKGLYKYDSWDKCYKNCKNTPENYDRCEKCEPTESPSQKGCYACVCKAHVPCCSTNPKYNSLACPDDGKLCYKNECKKGKDGFGYCAKTLLVDTAKFAAARCGGEGCNNVCCRPRDKDHSKEWCLDSTTACNWDYECVKSKR